MTIYRVPLLALRVGSGVLAVPLGCGSAIGGGGDHGGGEEEPVVVDTATTHLFPTGYPTDTQITNRDGSALGLRLYLNSNHQLIGEITAGNLDLSTATITSSHADYHEITANLTFGSRNNYNDLPNDTPLAADVTWRVPKQGKPYWQYANHNSLPTTLYNVQTFDCTHIMSSLWSSPSIRRIRFANQSNTAGVTVDSVYAAYNPLNRMYNLTIGSNTQPFDLDAVTLSTASPLEANYDNSFSLT
jgi:hypothetical protein